jgi:hypothetical protein
MDDPPLTLVVKMVSNSVLTSTAADVVGDQPLSPPVTPRPLLSPAEPPPFDVPVEPFPLVDECIITPPFVDIPLSHWWQDLQYNTPLSELHCYQISPFPHGSMVDAMYLPHPTSLTMPFEFLFDHRAEKYYDGGLGELPDIPSPMDSGTRVVDTPQVWVWLVIHCPRSGG